MLIETIRTAREATLQVKHTTAAISCARSVRGQSVIRYTGHSAIRTEGIEATVEILDQLKRQLAEEEKYAEECRLRILVVFYKGSLGLSAHSGLSGKPQPISYCAHAIHLP